MASYYMPAPVGTAGRPLAAYIDLAKQCRNDLQAMLQEIDAGAMLS